MFEVRELDLMKPGELEEALALVGKVFDEFEAPTYPSQGVENFHNSIHIEPMRERYSQEQARMWLAFGNETIIGVIALRNINHICLFFVDSAYHRQGVGKALYQAARNYLRSIKSEFVTVYSSPYAVGIYERLGFACVSEELLIENMYCSPMCAYIAHGEKFRTD